MRIHKKILFEEDLTKRMKILKNIEKTANGVAKGLFLNKSIQSIKAEMSV